MPKSKKAKAGAGPGAAGPCKSCGKAGAREYFRVAEGVHKGPYCTACAAKMRQK